MEYELIEHKGGLDLQLFAVTIYRRQTHLHSDIELIVPLEGDVVVHAACRPALVRQGDFFLVNRDEAHSLASGERPNLLLVMQINPDFCRAYESRFTNITIRQRHVMPEFMPRLHEALKDVVSEILRTLYEKPDGYRLLLTASLNRLAFQILRFGIYEPTPRERQERAARAGARTSRVVEYMRRNFNHHVTLGELAEREQLDPAYLSHFIKEMLGVSFREYIARLRLEHAADLILNTNMRMIDVCMESGYSDYRYLNRAFLSAFSITPAQYRQAGGAISPRAESVASQSRWTIEEVFDRIEPWLAGNSAPERPK